MAKCGKGCMPECKYFTTGGCVSPFNCPYKVENESITTATSTPCNLYPLETDKDKEIARLQAENAELRERLDKAVELPCAIGGTVYTVIKNCTRCQHYNVSWAECRAPATANFDCESTHGICFTRDIIDDECKKHLCLAELKFDLRLLDPKTGKLLPYYFTDMEAAEAKRRELKEKNND